MTRNTLADYRVIFTTPGTPPRQFHNVRTVADPDMPDWLVFEDDQGRPACMIPRECVLFVERLKHRDSDDSGEITEITESQQVTVVVNNPPPADGLARVAAAVRSARGGPAPLQVRGFA